MICTTGDWHNTAITALHCHHCQALTSLNCSTAHYYRELLQNIQLTACWPHTIVCCVYAVQPVSRSLPIRSSSGSEHCFHCLSCINTSTVRCRAVVRAAVRAAVQSDQCRVVGSTLVRQLGETCASLPVQERSVVCRCAL